IYLRKDLERDGERFESSSDTEVLLRLLARHGARALSLLNGMFALALVDTHARTFLLARDRLGVSLPFGRRRGRGVCRLPPLYAKYALPEADRPGEHGWTGASSGGPLFS